MDDDLVNKYEYNPWKRVFVIDTMNAFSNIGEKLRDNEEANIWADSYDFSKIIASGYYDLDDASFPIEGIKLPEVFYGNILLNDMKDFKKVTLPRIMNALRFEDQDLTDVIFPEEVDQLIVRHCNLRNVTFPKKMGTLKAIGSTFSSNVILPKGIDFVDVEGADINGMIFPEYVRHLDIQKCDVTGAKLPKQVNRLYSSQAYTRAETKLFLPEIVVDICKNSTIINN